MNVGTYAVYTISVSKSTHTVRDVLKQAVPESAIKESGKSLIIPRLVTFWRGDQEEQQWQDSLRNRLNEADKDAALIIESAEWTPATGYPQGDTEL